MRHCRLFLPILILRCILVKASLAATLDGGSLIGDSPTALRSILQSGAADWETCEAVLEYDPAFDAAAELQALTALYEATGGRYWTYGSYFVNISALAIPGSSGSSGSETALESLLQRFNRTAWLDTSVSYCQW